MGMDYSPTHNAYPNESLPAMILCDMMGTPQALANGPHNGQVHPAAARLVGPAAGISSPAVARVAPAPRSSPWRGAKLLFDLDETLIESAPGEEGSYSLERVRANAAQLLEYLRFHGANCYLTTAAADWYAHDMLDGAGLSNLFDAIFTRDALRVNVRQVGDAYLFNPKDYGVVVDRVCNGDVVRFLTECAVIGDYPAIDVSVNPFGLVTVLAPFDLSLISMLNMALELRTLGGGNFAAGYDLAYPSRSMMPKPCTRFVSVPDWHFVDGRIGRARLVCMGMERDEIISHLSPNSVLSLPHSLS